MIARILAAVFVVASFTALGLASPAEADTGCVLNLPCEPSPPPAPTDDCPLGLPCTPAPPPPPSDCRILMPCTTGTTSAGNPHRKPVKRHGWVVHHHR